MLALTYWHLPFACHTSTCLTITLHRLATAGGSSTSRLLGSAFLWTNLCGACFLGLFFLVVLRVESLTEEVPMVDPNLMNWEHLPSWNLRRLNSRLLLPVHFLLLSPPSPPPPSLPPHPPFRLPSTVFLPYWPLHIHFSKLLQQVAFLEVGIWLPARWCNCHVCKHLTSTVTPRGLARELWGIDRRRFKLSLELLGIAWGWQLSCPWHWLPCHLNCITADICCGLMH